MVCVKRGRIERVGSMFDWLPFDWLLFSNHQFANCDLHPASVATSTKSPHCRAGSIIVIVAVVNVGLVAEVANLWLIRIVGDLTTAG